MDYTGVTMGKSFSLVVFLVLILLSTSGCGVYMAFTQPEKVDQKELEAGGVPRDLVIEKLGAPKTSTKNDDGSRTETYAFYEGSASGWKIGRGTFHLLADVITSFLWEFVATPMEREIRGDKITAKAEFDQNDTLTAFEVLDREEKPHEDIYEEEEFY